MGSKIKSISRFWIISYAITLLIPLLLLLLSFLINDYYWRKDVTDFYHQAGESYSGMSDETLRKIEMLELELGWDPRTSSLGRADVWSPEDIYEALQLQNLLKNSLVTRPFLAGIALYFPDQEKVLTEKGLYDEEGFLLLFPLIKREYTYTFFNKLKEGDGGRKLFRMSSLENDSDAPLVLSRSFPLNTDASPQFVVISFLNEERWRHSFQTQIPITSFSGELRLYQKDQVLLSFSSAVPESEPVHILTFPSEVIPGYYQYTFPPPGRYGNYKWARHLGIAAFLLCLTGGVLFVRFFILLNFRQIQPIFEMVSPAEQTPSIIQASVQDLLDEKKDLSLTVEKQQFLRYICGTISAPPKNIEILLPDDSFVIYHWKGKTPLLLPEISEGRLLCWTTYNEDESLLIWNGPSHEQNNIQRTLKMYFMENELSAGQSSPVDTIIQLPAAYNQAREASEFSRLYGSFGVFVSDEDHSSQALPQIKGPLRLLEIWRHIKSGEWSAARRDTSLYIDLISSENLTVGVTRLQIYSLLATLSDGLGQLPKHKSAGLTDKMESLLIQFDKKGRIKDIEKEICSILKKIEENRMVETNPVSGPWSNQVSDYLNQHYSDSTLSVQIMAEELNTTASYLSSVFRRESGSGLLDYIHRERLKQSIPLLRNKNYSVKTISESVGFLGSNSYIRSFKKYLGITPGIFRSLPEDEKWAISEKLEDSLPSAHRIT